MDIVVGTAGHIDHGKTSLIKALTGVDADRLPEEKERGITIDIGFAELDLGEIHVGFVDVPGHERFVKNMLAGASGIDMVMLVIAADEGVKPQTREHFDICRLLETRSGFIVLTKCDLADAETAEMARLEAEELVRGSFLEGAPIIEASSKSGKGLDSIKDSIRKLSSRIPERPSSLITRLPIDRSFSMKGFGTVVTGTLAAGTVSEGDEMELLPPGKRVRVRGVQTHGRTAKSVVAGNRTAINLGGVDYDEVARGMTLAPAGSLQPTQMVDVRIETLATSPPIKSRQRVKLHIGTSEVLARIQILNESGSVSPGESAFAQIRTESPVVCVPEERFILRSYSPQSTIAGGSVLDNAPEKHREKDVPGTCELLSQMEAGDISRVSAFLQIAGRAGMALSSLRARTGRTDAYLRPVIDSLAGSGEVVCAGTVFVAAGSFRDLSSEVMSSLSEFHSSNPLSKGMPTATLKEKIFRHIPEEVFDSVLKDLSTNNLISFDKDTVSSSAHSLELSPQERICFDFLRDSYKTARLEVPKTIDILSAAAVKSALKPDHARKIFQMLLDAGELVKVTDEFYFTSESIQSLKDVLMKHAATTSDRLIDVPKFKEIAGLSRKFAIPLLEYFDREKVTRRAGDKRFIL